jgi:hypothetical protein
MRSVCIAIVLFSLACKRTPPAWLAELAGRIRDELASVNPTDGIDKGEATTIASQYLSEYIVGCGAVDEPKKEGNRWSLGVRTGYAGTPSDWTIVVDSRTGAVWADTIGGFLISPASGRLSSRTSYVVECESRVGRPTRHCSGRMHRSLRSLLHPPLNATIVSRTHTMATQEPWYAARCLFEHGDFSRRDRVPCYEERVVIFRARSFREAIRKAEKEAKEYCRGLATRYLGFVEAFHLFSSTLEEGVEVFSILRSKKMTSSRFIKTFYDDRSFHRGTLPASRARKTRSRQPANKALQRTITLPRSARAGARR